MKLLLFLPFLGVALSIVAANGWLVIPTYCIVLCYIASAIAGLVYSYARGVTDELMKKMKAEKNSTRPDITHVDRRANNDKW